nr:phosphopantetheine-binding protein [Pseudoalteromonas rubra]
MEISQPTNELEAILCDTFKSIVGAEQVSTTERFFDMGANSALLVQVYHAFRKQVDIEFKLIEMFKHPTVSGLIASIAQPATLQADTASSEAELERLRRKRTTLRNRLKKG